MRLFNLKQITICLSLILFCCAKGKINDPIDTKVNLTKNEFESLIVKDRFKKKSDNKQTEIPEISRLEIQPPSPISNNDILNSKRNISFSTTEEVPLKDVLIEIGRIADIDVEIDPNISGGIIVSMNNRPLGEVIDRIVKLGNLRYHYENGILHFERDAPYTKNYMVDYLSEGSNLWADVQSNITSILANNSTQSAATTNNATNTTTQNQNTQDASQNQQNQQQSNVVALKQSNFTINKTAGILSVFATEKQHLEIEKYLKDVQKTASAQVLIEAKVVEVNLNDEFQTGIDWSYSDANAKRTTFSVGGSSANTAATAFSLSVGRNLTASVTALEKFGTTRTLSSPRIHAINNQKAILNFTDKLVYFKIENNQNTTTTSASASVNTQTLTSTKQEENVGVELNITPSVNIKTNEVTLYIKPKITIKSGEVIDPASPTINGKTIENKVPVIQTREVNTVAKIQSGNIVVIGGLMKESTTNVDSGIPFLQRIPILGYLFKSSSKKADITETVIFIKASIIDGTTQVDKVDREIQEKFDSSKRKFF